MGYSRVPEEEIIPRGREIYEHAVRPELGPEHEGRFVVIDVESGDYEVSDDDDEAFGRAEERYAEAVFFVLRVGPRGLPALPTASVPASDAAAIPNGAP